MKLSTALVMGAMAATAAAVPTASSAGTIASVYEGYAYSGLTDNAFGFIKNDTGLSFTDVTVSDGDIGTLDLGALAAGATSFSYSLGDDESCGNGCPGEKQMVSILVDGLTFTGSFADIWNDIDQNEPGTFLGTVNGSVGVPEPASVAALGVGLIGLAASSRRRRV